MLPLSKVFHTSMRPVAKHRFLMTKLNQLSQVKKQTNHYEKAGPFRPMFLGGNFLLNFDNHGKGPSTAHLKVPPSLIYQPIKGMVGALRKIPKST